MNTQELYDKSIAPDLEVDGRVLLEMMGITLATVPSYTSTYAVLREQVRDGLLTERECSLAEEGRLI